MLLTCRTFVADERGTGVVERAVGAAMRLYRRSPLHPRLGRLLARALALLVRGERGPVLRAVGGFTFELDLDEVIDASLYFAGSFEAHAERAIASLLRPGMVVIDVGANVGYHTLRLARAVGARGRVIAVEPSSWATRKLRRNLALNQIGNVEHWAVGLDERDRGLVTTRFHASFRLDGGRADTEDTVPVRSLDSLAAERNLPRVDFIKIDVDGEEARVLRGAAQLLARDRPQLFFEVGPDDLARHGDSVEALAAPLRELGYRFEREDRQAIADLAAHARRIPHGCSANVLALP